MLRRTAWQTDWQMHPHLLKSGIFMFFKNIFHQPNSARSAKFRHTASQSYLSCHAQDLWSLCQPLTKHITQVLCGRASKRPANLLRAQKISILGKLILRTQIVTQIDRINTNIQLLRRAAVFGYNSSAFQAQFCDFLTRKKCQANKNSVRIFFV